jgi:arylsulfatase A-like enzyme
MYPILFRVFVAALMFLLVPGVDAWAGEKKDIYLVVWDTTRSDHLSVYGYERDTTPNLNKIAENSAVFTDSHASGGWTPPSVASLFTGLLSRNHLVDYAPTKERMDIPFEVNTLAEVLRDDGYHTALFTAQSVFYKDGYTQGFMEHEMLGSGQFQNRIPKTLEKAGDKPVFIVLYWLNPHAPYNPPKIHDLYTDPNGPQVNLMVKKEDKKLPGDFSHPEINSGKVVLDEAQWKQLKARYDGELHSNDQRMQNGIEKFKQLRSWDDTVFVMTSDHGEMFNERSQMRVWHGWPTHENQRVPLIIKAPGQKSRVNVDSQVRGIDVFPTVLELAGVSYDGPLNGKSLVPMMNGATEPDRPNLGASHYSGGLMFYRNGKHNLITSRLNDKNNYLYDLTADPKELQNLATSNPELFASVKAEMEVFIESTHIDLGISGETKVSSEEEAQLRALGYIE